MDILWQPQWDNTWTYVAAIVSGTIHGTGCSSHSQWDNTDILWQPQSVGQYMDRLWQPQSVDQYMDVLWQPQTVEQYTYCGSHSQWDMDILWQPQSVEQYTDI